jgi:ribosomal-protein-alanine N-acetyltransferase
MLGFALAWLVVDELQLIWIGTRTEHRRRGVGRALLDQLIEDARALGGRRVLLEVSRDNTAAIGLYERKGFSLMRVRRGYYRKTGQDALEMELVL